MEVKDTLLIMKTAFEMRAALPSKEPLMLQKWAEQDLYRIVTDSHKNLPPFILHDGPPYANGAIHFGHALNKILKDFVVRSQTKLGHYVPFIPGWDTHGLPIEVAVQKKYPKYRELSLTEYRQLCYNYALEQIEIQKSQFERLGLQADMAHPYYTLQKDLEKAQIEVFARIALDKAIYRGLKPIYWSPIAKTALAEAEIEYKDHTSHCIYVAFKVKKTKLKELKDSYLVIWTTTPWTIPANLAISANPNYNYGLYQTSRGKLLVLQSLAEKVFSEIGLEYKLLSTIKGSDLEYTVTSHPLYDRDSLVILGEHVTDETGTGLVHTAPGHGSDDYNVGIKYNLEILSVLDESGKMLPCVGKELEGLFYEDANLKVIELLANVGALLHQDTLVHSYPHDWRYKKPVVFRATPQWFASIDQVKKRLLEVIKEVTWLPAWGEKRMSNMIDNRTDWCISRQRLWGVPLPIIYNEDGSPIIEKEVFDHIAKIFAEKGSSSWWELDVKELLPRGYTNPASPKGKFKKEVDTMDVWFDSGATHYSVVKERLGYSKVDLYLEGNDQYRGWFNSSLITSIYVNNDAPYKKVLTHGMIVDGQGNKMSKSLGNGIDPLDICKQYGADVLRLLVSSIEYTSDIRVSNELTAQIAENYKKIRNTFRFMLGNLGDYKADKKLKITETIDLLILEKLNELNTLVQVAYDKYHFSEVYNLLFNFFVNELSSFYFDIAKDILYCGYQNELRRRQCQEVINRILAVTSRLFAPILVFTTEEIQGYIDNSESIHNLDFIKPHKLNGKALSEYIDLLDVRSSVLKAIEELRSKGEIKSSLEAEVELYIADDKISSLFFQMSQEEQKRLFIVSKVSAASHLKVRKTTGKKCIRCWNYYDNLVDELCPRCNKAILEFSLVKK